MALKYKYDITRKIVDKVVRWLRRLDLVPQHYYLLTVPGRKTGLPRSKPVALVEDGGQKWLVAPYGEVNWVLNARVAGKVTIARGGHSEEFSIKELPVEERASVLKQYITLFPITRSYFDTQPSDPVDKFLPEAQWRPVFLLRN